MRTLKSILGTLLHREIPLSEFCHYVIINPGGNIKMINLTNLEIKYRADDWKNLDLEPVKVFLVKDNNSNLRCISDISPQIAN